MSVDVVRRRNRVVVVGGGYAGVMAANRLSGRPDIDVTLINPRPNFVDRIRLHQWVAGCREATVAYESILAAGVDVRTDSAVRLDRESCQVLLASGDSVRYDYLIYAVGSTDARSAIPGAEEYAFYAGEWESAQRLRAQLAQSDPGDPITVIGGGLTGIEIAAELAAAGKTVRLVCASELAPSLGDRGRRSVRRRLAALGMEVIEHAAVREIVSGGVFLGRTTTEGGSKGEVVPTSVVVVATGFGISGLARASGLSVDRDGRLITDETLVSVDDRRIVGAGDAVAPCGMPYRMSCQAATPLGAHAADTVLAQITGSAPTPMALAFAGQNVGTGKGSATIQFTRQDDSPTGIVIAGSLGAGVKELVLRATLWLLRREARRPGSYRWFTGRYGREYASRGEHGSPEAVR